MKKNNQTFLKVKSTSFNNCILRKNSSQEKKPIKVVNLFIDNLGRQKLLNEDDVKLFLYTNRLFNQFRIDINSIRRAKSSKSKLDKNLYNCYKFFNKKIPHNTKNLVSIESQYNNRNGNLSERFNYNIATGTENQNIKKKFINRFNLLSKVEVNNIFNNENKNASINNIKNEIYYLPNFNTFSNLLENKLKNYSSFSFQNYYNHLSNFNNLNERDLINVTKINYVKTNDEKSKDNLNSQIYQNTKENSHNYTNDFNREKAAKVLPMKEKLKMFGFVNKKKNEILYDIPPPNYYDMDKYYYYNIFPENCGWLIKECFKHRTNWKECHSLNTNIFNFKWKEIATMNDFADYNNSYYNNVELKQMINHYEYNSCITNKYKLFLNFIKYCELKNIEIFKYIPFTIILDDSDYEEFSNYRANFKQIFTKINNFIFENNLIKNQIFDRRKKNYRTYFPLKDLKLGFKTYIEIPSTHYAGKNLWIIKAPNLNRGRCIKVFNDYNKIIKFINEINKGNVHEYDNINEEEENNIDKKGYKYKSNKIIIQKYIEKPFLYYGRKFDIRIWVLLTHKMKAYMFKEGHLKVSSINYDLDSNNSFIHLTNYSLQKYNKYFSKYEKGNEVSFETFQKYINDIIKKDINFKEFVYPQFIEIIRNTIKCSKNIINVNKRENCFELMGYDFLLDEEFNVFLLEINTNPGLEISSEIIKMLVPRMIDDALRLTVDDILKSDYSQDWKNQKGEYCSKFHVKGYKDEDNLWEFVCDVNTNDDKLIDNNINSYNNSIFTNIEFNIKKKKIHKRNLCKKRRNKTK